MWDEHDRRLDAAVSLGIITEAQAAEIRALTPDRSDAQPTGGHTAPAAAIGYALGALTVLIAMAWFLGDRWEWLGPGGVLAVSVLYAAVFLVVARRLQRESYPVAAGLAVVLAVGMTPVGTVALLELFDVFAPMPGGACAYPEFIFWGCRGEEIVVELATAAAALIALRRVRFSLLVLPLAAIGLRFLFHATAAVFGAGLGTATSGWTWMFGASLLTAVAYETSRRQRGDQDFATWLHLVAAFSAGIASGMLIEAFENFRHLLIPGAAVAFAFALRLQRFVWTLLGLIWFVAYLGWLAGEVFRDTPFFPIVLAALGIGVIVVTVWVQRNSARLVARFGALGSDGKPSFPGAPWLLLLPALLAALQLPGAITLDRATRRDSDARGAIARQEAAARRDSLEAVRRAGGAGAARETPGAPRP